MLKGDLREIILPTPYGRLAAKKWGPEDGLPVLGLHGWLDNANTFDTLAPLLAGIQLVSLDLPGHGKSDHRPPGVRYHYTDYVDDVMAAADALKWHRFALMGHSMGAGIGCLAASAFADRIDRLVIIEGLGAVTSDFDDLPERLRRSVEALRPRPDRTPPTYPDLQRLIEARAAVGKIRPDSARILLERATVKQGPVWRWRSDQRLKRINPQYFTNEVMLTFIRAIQAKVLLITAEDGTLIHRPYYESRRAAFGHLQHAHLPGGHHLHLDDPAPVAEVVYRFLQT